VEAAIGREQLLRLDSMLESRRRNAAGLTAGLAPVEGVQPQALPRNGLHAYHQYSIVVKEESFGISRDVLSERLTASGIMNGVVYPRGLHRQPVFERLLGRVELSVTDAVTEEILCIPVHHGLSAGDVGRIVEAIRTAPEQS